MRRMRRFRCRQREQPVVRADQHRGVGLDAERPARAAHTGIDHGEVHRARRKIGDGVPEHERAGENVLGRNAVGDVDGRHARSARRDHALHDADERIDQPEVGGERDQRSASSTAAHSSGNMISWWPVSWMPRPPIAVGRAITLTAGPVVALEVHVDGGEVAHPVSQVAGQVERLHEHLRQHHRRAQVQVDAALEAAHHRGELPEVAHASLADRGAVGVGMHVDDVGADGDVHGDGHAGPCGRREDARPTMREARRLDRVADGTPESEPGSHALTRGAIHELAGLARHAEETAVEAGADVLRGPSSPRHLEVVHQAGAVHAPPPRDARARRDRRSTARGRP